MVNIRAAGGRLEQQKENKKWRHNSLLPGEILCSLLFFGLPLVLWEGFFFITEAKAAFFLLACLVSILFNRFFGKIQRAPRHLPGIWAMGLFLLVQLTASLLGPDPLRAVLAPDNRYQGMLILLCYGYLYWLLSNNGGCTKTAQVFAAASFFVVSLLAILNRLGLDPLFTLAPLRPFDQGRYLSTLGNINFLSAYLVLFLPILLYSALAEEAIARRRWFSILYALGLIALTAAGCDSALLGLGAAVLLLPCLLGDRPRLLSRLPAQVFASLALCKAVQLLFSALKAGGLSPLFRALLSPAVLLPLWTLCLLLHLFMKNKSEGQLAAALRIYRRGLPAALALCLLVLFFLNTCLAHLPLGKVGFYLRFSDSWGTDRGRIWAACIKLYQSFPLWQKLIGGGSGVLAQNLVQGTVFPDAAVDAAHNEYLHILLTGGLLGLSSFISLLVLLLWPAGTKQASPKARGLALGIAAYAAQAFVNIAQPATTPLFFALLTLLSWELAGVQNPQKTGQGKY